MSFISTFFGLIICRPLGYILGLCYMLVKNYGLALLLFTVITRVFLFPLAVKQQKSSAEMLRIQPKLQEIQKKYAKDKERLNEEMMKLYQEEGYNPMGGCLPLLIQLPILWGLFSVIYNPLSYILGLSTEQINKIVSILKPYMANTTDTGKREIYAAQVMYQHMDKLSFLPHNIIHLNMNFLGIDLSATPGLKFSYLLLIPILCYITSLLSSWFSMKFNPASNAQASQVSTKSMNWSMVIVMPLVSAWFAVSVPAGVGFYWICTNLFMILQVFLLNKFYNPKRLVEESEEKANQRRQIRQQRAEKLREAQNELRSQTQTKQQQSGHSNTNKEKQSPVQKAPVTHKKKGGKASKKEIMNENRRRLAASRAAEKDQKDAK